MKKIRVRVLAFILCIFVLASQQVFVVAEGGDPGISGNDVSGSDISGSDVSGSDVSGGDVSGGDVSGSDVSGGDVSGADLSGIPSLAAETPGIAPSTGEHGSGSYQLNENPDHYRFYTEYFVEGEKGKSIQSAGIDRRTSIKVYAKEGEILLFGSSVYNSKIDENNQYTKSETKSDIVITTPGGGKISYDVLCKDQVDVSGNNRPRGLGYIANPTQEKYGPMVNHTDESDTEEKFYVPLQYQVEADGVYIFEFHSETGYNPQTANTSATNNDHPKPAKTTDTWNQGKTAVAAWDITVLGKNASGDAWEVKSGRAWADYLALTTGGAQDANNGNATVVSDLNVHVLSHDGYQYKVDFKQAAPFGFIFFANNTGFMTKVTDEENHTSTYRPIYHSFYDANNDLVGMNNKENIYLHKPDEQDTETEETYKIFFNAPNADLNGISYNKSAKDSITGDKTTKEDKIKTEPDASVTIDNLVFSGMAGDTSSNNIARTGHGGYFSFDCTGEAMVTIRLDLRKAIFESETTMDAYSGSGIVEITTPAVQTLDASNVSIHPKNLVYWNGRDTEGEVVPAGIYGNSNVVISTEIKRGELHFPVIDMEGLYGGLTVQRINGVIDTHVYDLYYNNNPLAYGTIEGASSKGPVSGYYGLSDGTKSYYMYGSADLKKYFDFTKPSSISTLKKDDKEYLAQKLFNGHYSSLSNDRKAIIDAEFDTEKATYHYEAVNSNTADGLMLFKANNFQGGGNNAGIDAWTYYSSGVDSKLISFAVLDSNNRGMIKGQIFYDVHDSLGYPDSKYDVADGDHLLSGIKVRLIDEDGKPLIHKEKLPVFDDAGHFKYDETGNIIFEDTDVKYETETDSTGTYRFTNVPYSSDKETTYYVQVMLTDVQSEVLRYTCTTSEYIKGSLKTSASPPVYFIKNTIDGDCGADGNAISPTSDASKIYGHKYDRNEDNETVFTKDNAQSVTFSKTESVSADIPVVVKEFKKIGFSSTVPNIHQKDYKIVKSWDKDSRGSDTHEISDGLIVELWVWNDKNVEEVNAEENKLSRRTGALVDTQVLHADSSDPSKSWTYTWEKLDDRLQYYVLEYYNKKKDNGEVIHNDKGEPRRVLIGGTMPIYNDSASTPSSGIYGFNIKAGDYSETITTADGQLKIPVQYFDDGKEHLNALTDQEKLESVDNNARQYEVSYTLTKSSDGKTNTNIITLTNSQVYDDRAYYVWLGHETTLPEMIALTFVDHSADASVKNSHPVTLKRDKKLDDENYTIKGLSISSVDAVAGNKEGNATDSFRIKDDNHSYAFFTPTDKNYKTGTGTRTYRVKYVVNKDTDASKRTPVSVTTVTETDPITGEETDKLVTSGTKEAVENNSKYIVYSWYMTIHVYNLEPDEVIEYDPDGGAVVLQEALEPGAKLEYKLEVTDPHNDNSIKYGSINDNRAKGIFTNDTFRVPLYKHAVHPDMGSCADIVGIYWAGSTTAEDSEVSTWKFEDTYESKYGDQTANPDEELGQMKEDGKAVAGGNGGYVSVELNTQRFSGVNYAQDHANYAKVTFTPTPGGMARAMGTGEDVFYYKVVVFAEDNMYLYSDYDQINALDGVVMYSYFTMKPKKTSSGGGGSLDNMSKDTPADTSPIKLGSTAPKTGDENNLMLWLGLMLLALAVIAISLSRRDKN